MIRCIIIYLLQALAVLPATLSGALITPHAENDFACSHIRPSQLGDLICRFTYDGLCRLIRKETPVSEGFTPIQKKEFYYDGVRRIQEVIIRPDLLLEENFGSGEFLTEGDNKNDESPIEMETVGDLDPGQEIVGDKPAAAAAAPGPGGPPVTRWTDREYIYGPDYVDEFIAQIVPQTSYTGSSGGPPAGTAYYMLQDANYNFVAIHAFNP